MVGGMSEHKQKRQLATNPPVVVATPGRLYELVNGGDAEHVKSALLTESFAFY